MSPDELQALIEDATFDYVSGDAQGALAKLNRATAEAPDSFEAWHAVAEINLSLRRLDEALAAGERAHALRKNDPLVIATLSRTWMERGDKGRAEHYGALARGTGMEGRAQRPTPARCRRVALSGCGSPFDTARTRKVFLALQPNLMETPSYSLEFEKPLRDLARQVDELRQRSVETNVDVSKEVRGIEKKIDVLQKEIYSSLTPWQKVLMARHPKRPYALDYVSMICKGFQELHGDRQFNDDRALVGGTAFFNGAAVMIIAQQKGRDPKERISRNFGMPQPEGYRKALRIMKMAEKFCLPILSFIDTPGAFPEWARRSGTCRRRSR